MENALVDLTALLEDLRGLVHDVEHEVNCFFVKLNYFKNSEKVVGRANSAIDG